MATKKQLAARALFVKRVRAGEFLENPIKRVGVSAKKYVSRPSQITKDRPTTRLKKRRAQVVKSPVRGYFPNPDNSYLYIVHRADSNGNPVYDIAKFRNKKEALEYARAYAEQYKIPVVLESKKL